MHNAMSIKETKDGVLISIFAKPNSSKFKIELDGGEIVVHATEVPEKGKVNREIIKEMTRFFGVKVELVSGTTSKEKQFYLIGLTRQQAEKRLSK
jgi:uncharacterized protein